MSWGQTKTTQSAPPLKSGGEPPNFAPIVVLQLLPGEDKREFDELRRLLTEKFKPRDILETPVVSHIAILMWRRERLSVFRTASAVFAKYGPHLESPDPELREIGLANYSSARLQVELEDMVAGKPAPAAALTEAHQNTLESAKKLLGPKPFEQPRKRSPMLDELDLATMARHVTPEQLKDELDLVARIDAEIFANIRRLEWLQAADERRSAAKMRRYAGQIRIRP